MHLEFLLALLHVHLAFRDDQAYLDEPVQQPTIRRRCQVPHDLARRMIAPRAAAVHRPLGHLGQQRRARPARHAPPVVMLADGGDALRHLKVLGGEDQEVLFGSVASAATANRTIVFLAYLRAAGVGFSVGYAPRWSAPPSARWTTTRGSPR